jgi:hypothetical protein
MVSRQSNIEATNAIARIEAKLKNSGIPTTPTTVSFPYPKWFWDRSASKPDTLLFRMF